MSQAHPTRWSLDLALLAATIAILTLFWRDVATATWLSAIAAAARLLSRPSWRDLRVWLVGFVFGSIAEIVQVVMGLYTYAQPSPLVIPLYNFFLWGAVLLAAASLLTRMEQALGDAAPTSLTRATSETAVYVAMTALLCFYGGNSVLVASVFAVALVLRLALARQPGDLWFAAVGMVLGPLVEAHLVHLGIYHFADPAIAGLLPLWHPLYWGLITLFLRRLVAWHGGLAPSMPEPAGSPVRGRS